MEESIAEQVRKRLEGMTTEALEKEYHESTPTSPHGMKLAAVLAKRRSKTHWTVIPAFVLSLLSLAIAGVALYVSYLAWLFPRSPAPVTVGPYALPAQSPAQIAPEKLAPAETLPPTVPPAPTAPAPEN
jgi:hypothetical protein